MCVETLLLNGKDGDIDLKVASERQLSHHGVPLAEIACLAKIKLEFSIPEGYGGARIFGEFNVKPMLSKAGFWIGVTDNPEIKVHQGHGQDNSRYFGIGPDSANMHSGIDIRSWKFGDKPRLALKRAAGTSHSSGINVEIYLLARPYFIESGGPVILDLNLEFLNEHGQPEKPTQRKITFNLDETAPSVDVYQHLSHLKAFENTGKGFSVHPKQLYTAYAVKEAYDKINRNKESQPFSSKVKIAYIGPDTTENLRTVFRAFDKQDIEITVFQQPEWDWSSSKYPLKGTDYEIDSIESVHLINISDYMVKENTDSFDIIVSTYVGYWAIGTTDGETSYLKLLNKIINKESIFITIDPRDTSSCVLSLPPDHIGPKQLNDFYTKKLELKKEQTWWNDKDETNSSSLVECHFWHRGAWKS